MFRRPRPPGSPESASNPGPSSRTVNVSTPRRSASRTAIGSARGVLARVPHRLGAAEPHGRLDLRREAAGHPAVVERHRRVRGAELGPQRRDEPLLGQHQRRHPVRGRGEHRLGVGELPGELRQPLPGLVEIAGGDLVLDQAERELQRDEVVLGAVVQVALDAPALAVHLGDGPAARHGDLLGVRERGPQLALQLDPGPAGLEDDPEAVGDVGEQLGALRVQPGHRLAVDGQHADLLGAVPDRHLDQVVGPEPGSPVRPRVGAVAQAGPADRQAADARAQTAGDGLGDPRQVGCGRRPRRGQRPIGQGRPGQGGDVGEHPVGRRPRAVEQPVDHPLGPDVQRPEGQRHQHRRHRGRPRGTEHRRGDRLQHDEPAAAHRHHEQHREAAAEPALGRPQPVVAGGDQHDDRDRGRGEAGEPEQQRDRGGRGRAGRGPWRSGRPASGPVPRPARPAAP